MSNEELPEPTDNEHESESESGEKTPREKGEEIGESAAKGAVVNPIHGIVGMCVGVFTSFVMTLTSIIPKGHKVWSGLYKTALNGMYKTSSADAIGFIARANGEVEPQPVKWKRATESGEKSRWVTKGTDEEWGPGTEGRGLERIGKVPVAFFDETSFDRTSMIEAHIAEAVDLGQTDDLYRDADIDLVQVSVDNEGGVDGSAVADGGHVEQRWEIRDPGVLDDVLIDLSSDAGDAMRVSWRKSKELLFEKATTEEMQMQEQRGRIAESDPEKERQKFMKIMFYAMIMVVAAAVGPEAVAHIFGSSGGGGGGGGSSVVPFMINTFMM